MTSDTDRLALVTGASSGIGRAIALELARRGWRLALVGRDPSRLDETVRACEAVNGKRASHAVFDMREEERFAAFLSGLGRVSLYVANHGVLDGRHDGEMVESATVAREVLDINLTASISALHEVLAGMQASGRGQIILVSSLGGLSPLADAPAYSASKAGLIAYGLSLREALRGSGVGVSVVCPGYVATPLGTNHIGNRPHEISAEDAARRILKAGLANRRLTGFPAPLWPLALFSLMTPEWLNRIFTRSLRFAVRKAP